MKHKLIIAIFIYSKAALLLLLIFPTKKLAMKSQIKQLDEIVTALDKEL